MRETECPNCGATFSGEETRCPYCGYINPEGAEAKYMDQLDEKRRDLDIVDDTARSGYYNEMKKGSGTALKIVIITALIIALLVGIWSFAEHRLFDRDRNDYAEELVWEHSRFEEYDMMLKAGEYEDLIAAIAEDSEKHDVWNWEHYDEFMEIADELWGNEE